MSQEWKSIYLYTKAEHEEAITMPFGMGLGTHHVSDMRSVLLSPFRLQQLVHLKREA